MNPELNKLEPLKHDEGILYRENGEVVPDHWKIFTKGETVIVKDCSFRISFINRNVIVLKPKKRQSGRK